MKKATIGLCGPETPFLQALRASFAGMPGVVLSAQEGLDVFVCLLYPGATGETRLAAEPVDADRLAAAYERCALHLLEQVHEALPRLQAGQGRRLCFVTDIASSVNLARDGGDSGSLVLAAANMAIRILFNSLRPLGYTFRVYASGAYDPAEAPYAAAYFLRDRSNEPESPLHSDENRLIMRNRWEQEIPW